jgi:hypothetical protein
MYKRIFVAWLFILAVCVISGCVTSVYVDRLNDSANRGIAYCLPKTVLKVSITYTLRTKTKIVEGMDSTVTTTYFLEKPVKITPLIVGDRRNILVVSGEDVTKNMFLESGLSYKFDDSSVLSSVDADTKDKTLEAVQSAVSSGLRIAAMVAPAGETDLPPNVKMIKDRIRNIYGEMGALRLPVGKAKNETLAELQKELATLTATLDSYSARNKWKIENTDKEMSFTVDPADFDTTGGIVSKTLQPELKYPPVRIILGIKTSELSKLKSARVAAKTKGIAYLVPVSVQVTIEATADGITVYKDFMNFAQFGPLMFAPVESKGLTSQKTSLVFGSQSGALTQYSIQSGSSADKIAGSFSSVVDSLRAAILDIRYNTKLQGLEKEKELTEAQTKLLQAQKDLEDAKKNLDASKKPQDKSQ